MQPTIEQVLYNAKVFAASNRIWGLTDQQGNVRGERPGKPEFLECIVAVESGDASRCFKTAEELSVGGPIVSGGPNGIYGMRHLCSAVWYKSQDRNEEYDRHVRLAYNDIEYQLARYA